MDERGRGAKPGVREQQEYYDRRWSDETHVNQYSLQRAAAVLDCLKETGLEYPTILDLGCGTGWLTAILSQFGPATGVELSPKAVETARKKYPSATFMAGDVFTLPLPSAACDVVVSQEVIEHVEDQAGYLDIVARCLKPGGYLILTTPNADVRSRTSKDAWVRWPWQPLEKWVSPSGLKKLLGKHFTLLRMDSIILGWGNQGMHRVVNSTKLGRVTRALGLKRPFDRFRQRFFYGLHLVALCRLKEDRR